MKSHNVEDGIEVPIFKAIQMLRNVAYGDCTHMEMCTAYARIVLQELDSFKKSQNFDFYSVLAEKWGISRDQARARVLAMSYGDYKESQ